ncbi:AraC family transcriptional regulator [Konateibacter massiliensis]|uniref:AraC family transcriptional regulator n=1 Tax=Konateibacter massiliensis TaxID=2002841 RepID=UPI0015D48561|nr:AraC family transcriptional regulator [Konateibacter massiliensis]
MKAFHEVRSYDSDFMVWHSAYKNISFLAHWHKEIELIYIRGGSARISINDTMFVAKEGDLVFCDSGNIHYSDSHDMDNSLDFLIFDPNLVSPVYEKSNFIKPLITAEMLEQLQLNDRLLDLIETVKRETRQKEAHYKEVVTAKLMEFWYLLLRRLPKEQERSAEKNKRNDMLYDLQQLLSYIDSHYSENLSLAFAADKMGFSESHFSKIFKKLMGTNYVNYINLIRVEHAAAQLKSTPDKVTDIAIDCGFNNIRNFNRVFKSITGYTPTAFAAAARSDIYSLSYYNRKSAEKQFVEQDSITLINNNNLRTPS